MYFLALPRRLERALTNLVRNAIQYGGRKGLIAVRVERPATLSVTDDGPGIPPPQCERVFEPFCPHGRNRGAGLGLNLVQEIVRRHGGEVAIREGRSSGARIEMVFRLAETLALKAPTLGRACIIVPVQRS